MASSELAAAGPERPHVVIIMIDGFPAYLLDDAQAPIPTLRALARGGIAAAGMRVINPSVTWPNHTTLVTGVRADKHSVLFNGVLMRPGGGRPVTVDPAKDQSDLIAVPTLFDQLHRAGLRTAAVNWPCTRNSPSIDDNFPDVPEALRFATPSVREKFPRSLLTDPTDTAFKALSSSARDQVWAEVACRVIREHKPDFLLLHLLVVDGLHHNYGPQSPAGYAGVALADRHVGDVLAALEAAGIAEQTTVFVLADHGFAAASKLLYPNVLLRKAGLLTAGPAGVVHASVMAVSEGGTALVYIDNRASAEKKRDEIARMFRGQEGVERVVTPDGFRQLGLPLPENNAQAPDLVLAAGAGYGFSGSAVGDEFVVPITMGRQNVGYHGYLSDNPKMNALFIAAGRGVRQGKVGVVENVDVAPTAARLLGQSMAGVDGKVLEEILVPIGTPSEAPAK